MDDVKKCGYLRKQKSMRRRYFVLRSTGPRGPARLEYYENEKKFRLAEGSGGPRGAVVLEEAFGVNKRTDAKKRHLLVLYTRDGGLCVSAEGEEEQEAWFHAILELQSQVRSLSSSTDGAAWPGPAFREVWQVSLRPRGLGQTRNLSGIYRLCLTERTMSLLRLRCDTPSVTLQLMNVRRCGHSDNYFFVEVGRSAVTGPGELWMQVEDSVVAQNMHETILEAMKSLSEEFRPRTKSQSLSSTPITVPSRRHMPNPPPPSQVGLSRRSRIEASVDSSPAAKPHSLPRDHSPCSPEEGEEKRPRVEANQTSVDYGSASSDEYGSSPCLFEPPNFLPPSPVSGETNYISMGQVGRRPQSLDIVSAFIGPHEEEDRKAVRLEREDNYAMMGKSEQRQEAGYMPMLPGSRSSQDYMAMTPNSISPPAPIEMTGYVMMSPIGSYSPDPERTSWPPSGEVSVGSADSQASDYMNMWPLSRSASSTPPPPEHSLPSIYGATRIPASYRSLPRSYKIDPAHPSHNSCSSSSDSLEDVSGGRYRRPLSVSVDAWSPSTLPGNYRRPPSPGEYVSIHFRAKEEKMTRKKADVPQAEYIAMDTQNHPVTNGDYTKMSFEPETLGSQVKMVAGHVVEKASNAIVKFGHLSTAEPNCRPAAEMVPWPLPTIEKSMKASEDDDFWPVVAPEKMFRPIAPADNLLAASAKMPPDTLPENTLGHVEKTVIAKASPEDMELRGLLAAVSGCNLVKGPDRAKLTRSDHPGRTRHCSDHLSNPASSCNGTRAPVEESGLNYIDLDLAKDVGSTPPIATLMGNTVTQPMKTGSLGASPCINTYASIDFQISGELRRGSRDGTEC
ncbi:insulin receptor substrate 1-like [Pseudophryne corroboree]|uniref:insulin receptor substrate 1-like n=1 Tax=Pseudophryne corroboree TaxID=495146 RepID=UPI0030814917